jgi:uncharacterized protein GlcG (DUF336 family)
MAPIVPNDRDAKMTPHRKLVCVGLAAFAPCASAYGATAAPIQDDVSLLLKMAEQARESCMVKGFATTVTIVGTDGQTIVVLRSDGAPIHTIQNSFNKAYTVMTLGPLMHADSTSALARMYSVKPSVSYALPMEPLPHISFSAGAVLIHLKGRLIGGLGVSGSNSGDTDEACASEGAENH